MKIQAQICFVLLLLSTSIHAQMNKGRLDGAVGIGYAMPLGSHAYSPGFNARTPLEFASAGTAIRIDCHAGLGAGWKVGLGLQYARSAMNEEAMSAFLLKSVDTIGYYVTGKTKGESFYETAVFSAQLANDLELDKFILTPHFAFGLTQIYMEHHSVYELKEMGSNYARTVDVIPSMYAAVSPVFNFGIRMAYSFDVGYGYLCPFLMAESLMYRTTVGMIYRTEDILNTSTTTEKWFSGDVRYLNVMLGASFYLK